MGGIEAKSEKYKERSNMERVGQSSYEMEKYGSGGGYLNTLPAIGRRRWSKSVH